MEFGFGEIAGESPVLKKKMLRYKSNVSSVKERPEDSTSDLCSALPTFPLDGRLDHVTHVAQWDQNRQW